ncbi:hypothetical protein D0T12_29535 [Actinomadura spongiicola]|uniref:Alkaline shock response membrane anchor protein AmaP n=1 Tax=Actinomadura spongiicola TaxID=2303421 RepID=A0A372G909_9ACTN|nr:hypothetical protein [Actinomadura spongiicola]RFS81860.1 hypothetical protein D0T12_29535 [Actinomadura spongiicola]
MRIAIALTGAALFLCGGAALAAGLGAFDALAALSAGASGGPLSARPLIDVAVLRFVEDNTWFLVTAAVVAEVAALAGQLWLVLQCRALIHRRWPDVDARTRVLARSAAEDLNRDARDLPGVEDSRVRLTGTVVRPRLRMRIVCAGDAHLSEIYGELGAGPVERYRYMIGMPDLPVVIRFRSASVRFGRRRRPKPDIH